MGTIVKQVSAQTTRYYWYPGEKREWIRAAVAVAVGAVLGALLMVITGGALASVTAGASATAGLAGLNFGRRDLRATHAFPEVSGRPARRAAIAHGSRAVWRGFVEGVGGAAAAVLIANLRPTGLLADWVLPIVPATVGALAHQAGMLYERLALAPAPHDLPKVPAGAGRLLPVR